jgi:hypothetical protein
MDAAKLAMVEEFRSFLTYSCYYTSLSTSDMLTVLEEDAVEASTGPCDAFVIR